jgi:hypothetical protein
MKLSIIDIAHHRNGISAAPFHVVVFNDGESVKIGVVFEQASHLAVFDLAKLAKADIAFGSNSYRGDQYEPRLRKSISDRENAEATISDSAINASDPVCIDRQVDELLARNRQVAVIRCIEDVQSVRPDLNDDQAWSVLKQCREVHDCELGFNWLLIETVADDLYPSDCDGDSETETKGE